MHTYKINVLINLKIGYFPNYCLLLSSTHNALCILSCLLDLVYNKQTVNMSAYCVIVDRSNAIQLVCWSCSTLIFKCFCLFCIRWSEMRVWLSGGSLKKVILIAKHLAVATLQVSLLWVHCHHASLSATVWLLSLYNVILHNGLLLALLSFHCVGVLPELLISVWFHSL